MIEIKEISSKKDITAFIRFANKLYEDNPYYVPDMLKSQVSDFDRDKNPGYAYCDTKCFLALKDGAIAGRIAAIYNTSANKIFNKNQMRFWHADFIDDEQVTNALFNAVEAWARELGCESIHGPLGFSDMDREGMLVEGFDRMSMFITYYNHPYYRRHMERLGYEKEIDWVEFRITLSGQDDPRLVKLDRLASRVEKRMDIRQVPLKNKRSIRKYVEEVFHLYNEVYTLFGMVPLTDRQVENYVNEFLPLIDERTTCILEDANGKVIAFGVAAPSISMAMRRCGGNMAPFGWYHILRALKGKNDTLDMFLIAVHPEHQGKGLNAIILNRLLKVALSNGIQYAETGPELESNDNVQSHWRYFDVEQHKRRRCFIKNLRQV